MYLKIITETVLAVYVWMAAAGFSRAIVRDKLESCRFGLILNLVFWLPVFMVLAAAMAVMPFYFKPPHRMHDLASYVVIMGLLAYWLIPILLMALRSSPREMIIADKNKVLTGWIVKPGKMEYYEGPAGDVLGFWVKNFGFSWFVRGFWIDTLKSYDPKGNEVIAICSSQATPETPMNDRDKVMKLARDDAQGTLWKAAQLSPDIKKMADVLNDFNPNAPIDYKFEKVVLNPRSIVIIQKETG